MKQKVSELMDSELDEHEAAQAFIAMDADNSLKQAWHDYHLIGDVMRAHTQPSIDVCDKVSMQLKAEPTALAPRSWRRDRRVRVAGAAALAASMSFIAVIAWQQAPSSPHVTTLAGARQAHPSPQRSIAGDDANAYFLAHQELTVDQGLMRATYQRGAAH